MLRLRLSNVLDEQLEAFARSVVLPAGRMAERGERTGSFIDGLLHLLFPFAVTTLHCGPCTRYSYHYQVLSLNELSLDLLMTGSAHSDMVRVDTDTGARACRARGGARIQ